MKRLLRRKPQPKMELLLQSKLCPRNWQTLKYKKKHNHPSHQMHCNLKTKPNDTSFIMPSANKLDRKLCNWKKCQLLFLTADDLTHASQNQKYSIKSISTRGSFFHLNKYKETKTPNKQFTHLTNRIIMLLTSIAL